MDSQLLEVSDVLVTRILVVLETQRVPLDRLESLHAQRFRFRTTYAQDPESSLDDGVGGRA